MTPKSDAVQSLLGKLATVEARAITDHAWWQLLRELEARLDGIPRTGCTCQQHQPMPPDTYPAVIVQDQYPVHTPAQTQPADTGQTLAHHPLASTLLGFLPYEYQTLAWNLISSVRITRRTIVMAVAVAVGFGWYSGRISIPPALTTAVSGIYLSGCPVPPQPQTQPAAVDPATGLPYPTIATP